MYCGKIFIPKYQEEENHFVRGVHQPIVSDDLFNRVQDILDSEAAAIGQRRKQVRISR
jgi:hypothetical protein